MNRPSLASALCLYCWDSGQYLVAERIGSHESGTLCLPGGYMEGRELPIDTLIREGQEELGIDLRDKQFSLAFDGLLSVYHEEKQTQMFMFVFTALTRFKPEVKIMEPNKCSSLQWVTPLQEPPKLCIGLAEFSRRSECLLRVTHRTRQEAFGRGRERDDNAGYIDAEMELEAHRYRAYYMLGNSRLLDAAQASSTLA